MNNAQIVFATCVGAGVGLLRFQKFDIVLIDGVAQQVEPETLIPLTKGCQRAILIGDHAQPRASVSKHACVTEFDVSLFERNYDKVHGDSVAKILLDIQYHTQPEINDFSSKAFYRSQLQSTGHELKLPLSKFPWPRKHSMVFVQSHSQEDLGYSSKSNPGQANICRQICSMLMSHPGSAQDGRNGPTNAMRVAIVTPYSRQQQHLKRSIPAHDIYTIDEFHGKQADIVIFVTVRCNAHFDIGCLNDQRSITSVMTGAKVGMIFIGDRSTLCEAPPSCNISEAKATWKQILGSCANVTLQPSNTSKQLVLRRK